MKNKSFGKYLEDHKGNVSIQQIADIYGCSRSYIWDMLKGNVNPPQDYIKVKRIAEKLALTIEEENELFNKTAMPQDIPIDIKWIIVNNPEIIRNIRLLKSKGEF